tara:strand:- start:11331 stop:11759 length:429 start_codon:yes stop_codon:yes gene_type:complete
MRVFIRIIILSIIFCACRKPNPNPELKDPIYKELQERMAGYKKDIDFTLKEKERIEKYISETHPHDPTLQMKRKTLRMNDKNHEKAKQQYIYTQIALENRKKEVRIEYLEAFKQGKEEEWQNKNEISARKSRMQNNSFLERE